MNELEINNVKKDISKLLNSKHRIELCYHNLAHTMDVFDRAVAIGLKEGLCNDEIELLSLAALFHDVGYVYSLEEHEARSCREVKTYLAKYNIPKEQIRQICEAIMATKIPQQPKSKIGSVLCDADLDYLGREDYPEIANRLKRELEHTNPNFNPDEWLGIQIKFLESHSYFTLTSKKIREPYKKERIAILKGQFNRK